MPGCGTQVVEHVKRCSDREIKAVVEKVERLEREVGGRVDGGRG
jgi:hypothetical protein